MFQKVGALFKRGKKKEIKDITTPDGFNRRNNGTRGRQESHRDSDTNALYPGFSFTVVNSVDYRRGGSDATASFMSNSVVADANERERERSNTMNSDTNSVLSSHSDAKRAGRPAALSTVSEKVNSKNSTGRYSLTDVAKKMYGKAQGNADEEDSELDSDDYESGMESETDDESGMESETDDEGRMDSDDSDSDAGSVASIVRESDASKQSELSYHDVDEEVGMNPNASLPTVASEYSRQRTASSASALSVSSSISGGSDESESETGNEDRGLQNETNMDVYAAETALQDSDSEEDDNFSKASDSDVEVEASTESDDESVENEYDDSAAESSADEGGEVPADESEYESAAESDDEVQVAAAAAESDEESDDDIEVAAAESDEESDDDIEVAAAESDDDIEVAAAESDDESDDDIEVAAAESDEESDGDIEVAAAESDEESDDDIEVAAAESDEEEGDDDIEVAAAENDEEESDDDIEVAAAESDEEESEDEVAAAESGDDEDSDLEDSDEEVMNAASEQDSDGDIEIDMSDDEEVDVYETDDAVSASHSVGSEEEGSDGEEDESEDEAARDRGISDVQSQYGSFDFDAEGPAVDLERFNSVAASSFGDAEDLDVIDEDLASKSFLRAESRLSNALASTGSVLSELTRQPTMRSAKSFKRIQKAFSSATSTAGSQASSPSKASGGTSRSLRRSFTSVFSGRSADLMNDTSQKPKAHNQSGGSLAGRLYLAMTTGRWYKASDGRWQQAPPGQDELLADTAPVTRTKAPEKPVHRSPSLRSGKSARSSRSGKSARSSRSGKSARSSRSGKSARSSRSGKSSGRTERKSSHRAARAGGHGTLADPGHSEVVSDGPISPTPNRYVKTGNGKWITVHADRRPTVVNLSADGAALQGEREMPTAYTSKKEKRVVSGEPPVPVAHKRYLKTQSGHWKRASMFIKRGAQNMAPQRRRSRAANQTSGPYVAEAHNRFNKTQSGRWLRRPRSVYQSMKRTMSRRFNTGKSSLEEQDVSNFIDSPPFQVDGGLEVDLESERSSTAS